MSEPFDSMVADVFAILGTAAVFTPAAGSEVSLYVNVETEHFADPGGYQAQVAGTVTEIEYLIADIGRVAVIGETFTVGATTYTVQQEIENDSLTAKVIVR